MPTEIGFDEQLRLFDNEKEPFDGFRTIVSHPSELYRALVSQPPKDQTLRFQSTNISLAKPPHEFYPCFRTDGNFYACQVNVYIEPDLSPLNPYVFKENYKEFNHQKFPSVLLNYESTRQISFGLGYKWGRSGKDIYHHFYPDVIPLVSEKRFTEEMDWFAEKIQNEMRLIYRQMGLLDFSAVVQLGLSDDDKEKYLPSSSSFPKKIGLRSLLNKILK